MQGALNKLSGLPNLFGFGLFLDLPNTDDRSTIVAELKPINDGIKLSSLGQLSAGLSHIGTEKQEEYIAFNLDIHRQTGVSPPETYKRKKGEAPIVAYTVGTFGKSDREPTLLYDIPLECAEKFHLDRSDWLNHSDLCKFSDDPPIDISELIQGTESNLWEFKISAWPLDDLLIIADG